ncbi:MAG: class I SAM-dependent methyltransferase [Roseiflexus castenholzii]|nr:MAG: class I SAM-dependent methyltransferase [Roseiflexus castenholzii]
MSAALTTRQQIERTHHDRVASRERRDFYAWGALDIADAYACSLIDSPQGKVILDLGCGRGAHTVRFAQSGAHVAAIDLSGGMVTMTQQRAITAGVGDRVAVQQMSAESLGFADATFDYVFGHSVLHHTDLSVTRREVWRAVFLEPLDHNPLLNLFRRLTPWRRTPTEKPLSLSDLYFFTEPFAHSSHCEFYLLALGAFVFVPLQRRALFQRALRLLNVVDQKVFRQVPALRRYAWVTVLELRR